MFSSQPSDHAQAVSEGHVSLYSHLKEKYKKYHSPEDYRKFVSSSYRYLSFGSIIILAIWIVLWVTNQITVDLMKGLGNGINLNLAVLAANAILVVLTTSIVLFYQDSLIPFDKSDAVHSKIKDGLLKKHGKADEVYIIDFDAKNRDDLNFFRIPSNAIREFSKKAHVLTLILIFITTGLAILDIPLSTICSDGFKGCLNAFIISVELLIFVLLSHYGIKYLQVAMQMRSDVFQCINSNHFDNAYNRFKAANQGFKPDDLMNDIDDLLSKK